MYFCADSLNTLEDNDLDALMAELVADCTDAEMKVNNQISNSVAFSSNVDSFAYNIPDFTHDLPTGSTDDLSFLPPPPPSEWEMDLPPPPPDPEEPTEKVLHTSKSFYIKNTSKKCLESIICKVNSYLYRSVCFEPCSRKWSLPKTTLYFCRSCTINWQDPQKYNTMQFMQLQTLNKLERIQRKPLVQVGIGRQKT